jgi:GT2 family glycosyltransferase
VSAAPAVSVSVVSHGQGALVAALLRDLAAHVRTPIEALVTVNIPESLPFETSGWPFPVKLIENAARKGFGENHNGAFRASTAPFFCVINPDIRLAGDPFPPLLALAARPGTGVAAPLIRGPGGSLEDSARPFPTPLSILRKALAGPPPPSPPPVSGTAHPDWVAGMFMLFRREVYAELGGFDERYFLYYEDVDLCARLRLAGRDVVLTADAEAVHDARRQSHRDPRYLRWHLGSMLRFFASPAFRTLMLRRR